VNKTERTCGMWDSPITPRQLALGVRLSDVVWDSDGDTLVWLEGRSDRGVLVAVRRGEGARDLTAELSVRARVGYGGGDFTVACGIVYFISGGRIYRQSLAGGAARPITPPFGEAASPTVSPDGHFIIYVHSDGTNDAIAICDTEGKYWPKRIASGNDFYMHPCWHPNGKMIAWISWDHPNMPWDGTQLHLATLQMNESGLPVLHDDQIVAGGKSVAIFQPQFSPDGKSLAYVSDESGYGNLMLYDLENAMSRPLTSEEEDLAQPGWVQGERTYGFASNGCGIIYRARSDGRDALRQIDIETGRSDDFAQDLTDYSLFSQVSPSPTEDVVALIAQGATIPPRIVTCTLGVGSKQNVSQPQIHRFSATETIPQGDLSTPEQVAWESDDGEIVHGLYYTPCNEAFVGRCKPPAIVQVHGGPTSQYAVGYHAQAQFFTSRGYAVLQVNHRGSIGYGRAYREALNGRWGIIDVEDTAAGARFLAQSERADGKRLVIMGGSAGGYTVLRCLTEHPGLFRAALCLYGVSDLFRLALETHKFEAHYLDTLVGKLPETSAVYRERSPINSVDKIVDPIGIFQGEDDRVVPKEQSEVIVDSLQRRGIKHEYHLYPGEGHGFRKVETIEAFYRDVERFLRETVLFS
jgi:dipeptidyl aminopeptidase/acylaminoacyl peptidase